MSVIINMELPESCKDCPIVHKTKSSLRCPIASKKAGYSCTSSLGRIGRPDHCPIQATELPEGDAEIDFPFVIDALKRSEKKKPEIGSWNGLNCYICPNCHTGIYTVFNAEAQLSLRDSKFCDICGQALDWAIFGTNDQKGEQA